MSYGNSNGKSAGGTGASGAADGDAARDAYYAQLDRVNRNLRALLDTFGEAIRRARQVERIDRSFTDREVALQLRLTSSTYLDVAEGLDPLPKRLVRNTDEVTTETRRKKKPDSSPGHKRS